MGKDSPLKPDLLKLFHSFDSEFDTTRLVFLPRLSHDACMKLMKQSRVVLDTFYWGAGITAFESFAMGAPMITLPTKWLCCRFTYAMYKEMEFGNECIAEDRDDYVRKAISLQYDDERFKMVKSKIERNNHVLFEDENIIKHWERILSV